MKTIGHDGNELMIGLNAHLAQHLGPCALRSPSIAKLVVSFERYLGATALLLGNCTIDRQPQ